MRKVFGTATAIALGLTASAASAAEFTGTIEEIDRIARNILVSSAGTDETMRFAVSDTNTVGARIDELEEGETVHVFYGAASAEGTAPVNAMQIDQVAIGEWQGPLEGVDRPRARS
jgi:hypothetical protein